MSIHDELHRIAERAPVASVPDDVWARASRARRRERVLMLGAAVAVLALVAGLVAWLPARLEPPVADTGSIGVPDRLYAVPEGVEPSSDLDIGRAVGAWQDYSRVVVVGADGVYHVLMPEGYDDLFMTGSTVALSPDGTQLAYAWADHGADAGLRVADLETGDVRTVSLGDEPVAVEHLVWSANSLWLAWQGTVVVWQDSGHTGAERVAGRVPAGSTTSQDAGAVPNDANLSLAVTPGGTVLFVTTNALLQARPGYPGRIRHAYGRLSATGVTDPATGLLGVGVGGDGPVGRPREGTLAVQINPASGGQQVFRAADPSQQLRTSPLGYVGTDLLVGVTVIEGTTHVDRTLQLVGPGHEPRVVSRLDDRVPYDLTVATDLMTPDRPTVHRPEPDWPTPFWNGPRLLLLALVIAAVLTLLVLHARRRQR